MVPVWRWRAAIGAVIWPRAIVADVVRWKQQIVYDNDKGRPVFFSSSLEKYAGYLDQVLEPLFWPRREDADIVGGDRRVQIARFPSSPSGERKQKQVGNFEKFVSFYSLIGSACQD